MLLILLTISVISLTLSIYQLMENNSFRLVIAPVVGLLFGYIIYSFGLGIYIFVLIPMLVLPIIAMIVIFYKDERRKST